MRQNRITCYTSQNHNVKCGVVKMLQRTIKSKLSPRMTDTRSNRYIDKLQDVIDSYNATYHTSIKMAPQYVTKNDVNMEYGKCVR